MFTLVIIASVLNDGGVALSSFEGFNTQKECQVAGNQIVRELKKSDFILLKKDVQFSCITYSQKVRA